MRASHLVKAVLALAVAAGSFLVAAGPADAGTGTTYQTRVVASQSSVTTTYGTRFTVSGQVQGFATDSQWHGVPGGTVYLQRLYVGGSAWANVGTATLPSSGTFSFRPAAYRNAYYRVVYPVYDDTADSATFAASQSANRLKHVRRDLNDRNPYGTRIVGNVNPGWAHRYVTVQRKTCGSCAYKAYKRVKTSGTGVYGITVPAPSRGSWYYRLFIPAGAGYVSTLSGVYRAYRV